MDFCGYTRQKYIDEDLVAYLALVYAYAHRVGVQIDMRFMLVFSTLLAFYSQPTIDFYF
jgi:hypothetical protein